MKYPLVFNLFFYLSLFVYISKTEPFRDHILSHVSCTTVVSLCTIYEILIDNLRILSSNDFKHHGLSVCPARGHFAHLDTITGLELLNSVEIIKISRPMAVCHEYTTYRFDKGSLAYCLNRWNCLFFCQKKKRFWNFFLLLCVINI